MHGTVSRDIGKKKTYSLFFLISRSNWAYSILSGNQPYTRPTHCMKCWSEFACLKSHWHLYWRILGNRGECVCLFVYAFCFSAFFKNISTTFCTHFCLGSRHTSFPLTSFTMISEFSQCGPLSITVSSLINLGLKGVEWVFMHWHRSSELILDKTAASHRAAESMKAAKRATTSLEVMLTQGAFVLVSSWLLS